MSSLIETLALETIEVNLFRGESHEKDFPRIFGGTVIAQALLAAYKTVEGRVCHSLHAYFLRPGDPSIPILYEVDRARDGHSFTTRRVVAIQHGQQIFNLAASFQIEEAGFEHQWPMPELPAAESLTDDREAIKAVLPDLPPRLAKAFTRERPIEMRSLSPQSRVAPKVLPPETAVWVRARAPIGAEVAMQQAVLAYASDMGLLETSMRPHGVSWQTPGLQSASLDHAIWFHRRSDFSDWHLYSQDSPSASGARGFVRGSVHSSAGTLVASVAQEGLIRFRE
ncbi:MAG TPA: acyl-CoA thioesterase II [Aliidongia sp.]|nr:acyl-CoA thioesterase II [Aliidongia sp.]